MIRCLMLAILFFGAFTQALRASSCTAPNAPFCATTYGKFDDDSDFNLCKSEMETYRSEVEDFLHCRKRESQEALDEYNNAVESFNRRASGD